MLSNKYLSMTLLILAVANTFISGELGGENSYTPFAVIALQDLNVAANTGEKPQSKVWFHDNRWWAVLPDSTGTKLWQLDNRRWVSILHLSDLTNIHADTKALDHITHILLYSGIRSELVSVEYKLATHTYQIWSKRRTHTSITLDSGVETATIDVDSSGRMWLASDGQEEIVVRWSDPPYANWSKPITLAKEVSKDDICVVVALPKGHVGVLWSNQRTKRFGFKLHLKDTSPTSWSKDEIPASGSAEPVGDGMADDHLNCAVGRDGTLYAAVKTSYDTRGYSKIALLVRRSSGEWDKLYNVDESGTRGIVLLNERSRFVMVVYTAREGQNNIVYKVSNLSSISFGHRRILLTQRVNNATSTKQSFNDDIVILASTRKTAKGVRLKLQSRGNQHE